MPIPDRAIEDWSGSPANLAPTPCSCRAALHPSEADVPPEAMLDPVANTLDLRQPFDKERARRVEAALRSAGVGMSDIGYFDNLLHHDPAIRRKKREFVLRVFDAAVLLGVDAVCGFVGRNQRLSMDENLVDVRDRVRPAAEGGESARADLPRRAVPDAGLDDRATTFTTTSPTRRAHGSRCTGFASGMASAISSGFTTIRRTRS